MKRVMIAVGILLVVGMLFVFYPQANAQVQPKPKNVPSVIKSAEEEAVSDDDDPFKASDTSKHGNEPLTKTSLRAGMLSQINLNETLLAKREAAMDAMEEALQKEVDEMVAEHQRRLKEMQDWRAKEREKLGAGQ